MREVQLQSLQRGLLPAVLKSYGTQEELLHNSGRRAEALQHAEKLAETALGVGLVLSDINALEEKTIKAILDLIESRKEPKAKDQ